MYIIKIEYRFSIYGAQKKRKQKQSILILYFIGIMKHDAIFIILLARLIAYENHRLNAMKLILTNRNSNGFSSIFFRFAFVVVSFFYFNFKFCPRFSVLMYAKWHHELNTEQQQQQKNFFSTNIGYFVVCLCIYLLDKQCFILFH